MQTYEKLITVCANDLDYLNHVNNVRYVQWVQDIAAEHWTSRASQDILNTYFWVLLKHTIEYKQQAILGDIIRITTFVIKSEGVTSIRKVEMHNHNTDKLLVTSETTWCFLSKITQKPARITNEIITLF